MLRRFAAPLILSWAASAATATPPEPADTQALAKTLCDLLLQNLPAPLVETGHNWDHQKNVLVGVAWHRLKPDPHKAMRNDGHWQKLRVEAVDPARTLAVGARDVKYPTPGTTTFEALIGLDVRLTSEQQLWKSGVRLYSGETRARCRAALRVACELTDRVETKPGAVLPDVVFRVRATEAELFYADLVCEHAAGVGGDAARVIGEAAHKLVRQVKPSLERDLLARANAAVVKAADTKDVRVEFDKLLAGQAPGVTRGGRRD